MKKILIIYLYYLGLWGLFGFFFTLIMGFLFCCFNFSQTFFYISLLIFLINSIICSYICVNKNYKKTNN